MGLAVRAYLRFFLFLVSTSGPLYAQTGIQASIIDEIRTISMPTMTLRCAGWYEATASWLNEVERNPEFASEAIEWSESLERFGAQQLAEAPDPNEEATDLAVEIVHMFRDSYLLKIKQNIELYRSELGKDGILESDMSFCLRLVQSIVRRGSPTD